jgi:hypothetical protein
MLGLGAYGSSSEDEVEQAPPQKQKVYHYSQLTDVAPAKIRLPLASKN